MFSAVSRAAEDADAVVMCAAVADFKGKGPLRRDQKENFDQPELEPTVDILSLWGRRKEPYPGQVRGGNRRPCAERAERCGEEPGCDRGQRRFSDDIRFESDDNRSDLLRTAGPRPSATKDGIAVGVWRTLDGKLFRG
jgi:phosphopantothenoylcysteine synthetase/decarboxylase